MSGMEMVGRVGAGTIGTLTAIWILISAIRTMVIPRPERVWITSTAFVAARSVARAIANKIPSAHGRHRVLGAFAPVVLIALPLIWTIGLTLSFSLINWSLVGGSFAAAVELSGSSLTTLGFSQPPNFGLRLIAILEALLGLAVIALVIGFLPTFYSTFSRREVAVGRLTVRAGEPPTPAEFLVRLHAIDRIEQVGDRWEEWESWFVELGETHTSFPALIYFRSPRPGRSWLAAAETALDTAAVVTSCRIVASTGQAETMMRSGYLALRAIADFYGVEPERDPTERESISVARQQFDQLLDRLETGDIEIHGSRDEVWDRFAGWRVNYDMAIDGLKHLVSETPSHWSDGSETSNG